MGGERTASGLHQAPVQRLCWTGRGQLVPGNVGLESCGDKLSPPRKTELDAALRTCPSPFGQRPLAPLISLKKVLGVGWVSVIFGRMRAVSRYDVRFNFSSPANHALVAALPGAPSPNSSRSAMTPSRTAGTASPEAPPDQQRAALITELSRNSFQSQAT